MIPSARANRTADANVSFCVHGRWDEVVPERVHRHQRRQPDGVAEVVRVDAARQRRARRRLGGDEPRGRAVSEHAAQERERQPAEVRAAADARDHGVGLLAGHLHLGERLLPDHRLVQQDVVEDGPERVVRVRSLGRDLDRLGDRDPE
jgi:hypothetical protein